MEEPPVNIPEEFHVKFSSTVRASPRQNAKAWKAQVSSTKPWLPFVLCWLLADDSLAKTL